MTWAYSWQRQQGRKPSVAMLLDGFITDCTTKLVAAISETILLPSQ